MSDTPSRINIVPVGLSTLDAKKELWFELPLLEELSIESCWTKWLDLKSLSIFGSRLKKLDLSLYGVNGDEHFKQPNISFEELRFILKTCPELNNLGICMDKSMVDSISFTPSVTQKYPIYLFSGPLSFNYLCFPKPCSTQT